MFYLSSVPLYLLALFFFFFFFNDTAPTEIYTLSLHDALPISGCQVRLRRSNWMGFAGANWRQRSEEHTSELQSRGHLVCRLLLEKKKKKKKKTRKLKKKVIPAKKYSLKDCWLDE